MNLHERGDYATAETLYREVIATESRLLGSDHLNIALFKCNLAEVLED